MIVIIWAVTFDWVGELIQRLMKGRTGADNNTVLLVLVFMFASYFDQPSFEIILAISSPCVAIVNVSKIKPLDQFLDHLVSFCQQQSDPESKHRTG